MINTYYLSIAGFVYKIEFADIDLIYYQLKWLSDFKTHFKSFLVAKIPKKIDHTIRFIDRGSYEIFENKKERLMAYIENNSPNKLTTYYTIGLMQFESILMNITEKLLAKHGGFFFHASAILKDGEAVLATGKSGSGKSTFARLACQDYKILADDFVMVRKARQGYTMYQAPRYEKIRIQRRSSALSIRALLFLKKSPNTSLRKIESKLETTKKMTGQLLILEHQIKNQLVKNYLIFIHTFNHHFLLSFSKNAQELRTCIEKNL